MASGMIARGLVGALVLGLAEVAVVIGIAAAVSPAAAQVDDRFPFLQDRNRHRGSGWGGWGGWFQSEPRQQAAPVVENNSKAPPSVRKADSAPLTSVVVLGDSMADWLAYGLEQAAAESPDIGIVRRHRTYSGLIRLDVKNDPRGEYPDWPQAARELLNSEKPNFIVMMIGLNDRRPIREKAPAKPGAAAAQPQRPPVDAEKDAERDTSDESSPAAEEPAAQPERVVAGMVTQEFRSDKWTELYIKRIDETIAALKSKNVPVFWVGLPPIRSPKASGDLSYLNDLFRSRAEKAGITYIDTWDGFVDEAGRFVMQGPDFEGQIRRLRSGDGIHFTQAGARKLAHYVEREIQRALMANVTPVSLPAVEEPAPQSAVSRSGNAAMARPLAGPVMPLTSAAEADELMGGSSARQIAVDPIASRVLVHGEPAHTPAGRADDFTWPRRDVAPLGTDPVVATTTTPMTPMQPDTRQAANAPGGGGAAAAVPARRAGQAGPGAPSVRQASVGGPRPPGTVGQQRPEPRRLAPTSQPFFFPFFGR
jgi:uncharacterized protein